SSVFSPRKRRQVAALQKKAFHLQTFRDPIMSVRSLTSVGLVALVLLTASQACADVGDPQIRTDHPWYPGELACSTFERLFATQAALYERVVGVRPTTDEQKALAAWLWRNTHYYHGEDGAEDVWGQGFTTGGDLR